MNKTQPPKHGGDLTAASRQYSIPLEQWLDLSTGINPDSYPVTDIPQQYFHQLPEVGYQPLIEAAKAYYQVDDLLVGAGSQAFIEALPLLRQPCRVAIPDVGYQEHSWHWQQVGHQVVSYSGLDLNTLDQAIRQGDIDCAVVINPNNPTTQQVTVEQLEYWRTLLSARGGWLIIDEAFIDTQPANSFAASSHLPGVIVLRSMGKFFGLAGIRIGFALADKVLLDLLSARLLLWSVSGVSQYVATKALRDKIWQDQARENLRANSQWMQSTLQSYFPSQNLLSNDFFISVMLEKKDLKRVAGQLAQQGIWVRQWPFTKGEKGLLRVGLISDQDEKERFKRALEAINEECDLPVSP